MIKKCLPIVVLKWTNFFLISQATVLDLSVEKRKGTNRFKVQICQV